MTVLGTQVSIKSLFFSLSLESRDPRAGRIRVEGYCILHRSWWSGGSRAGYLELYQKPRACWLWRYVPALALSAAELENRRLVVHSEFRVTGLPEIRLIPPCPTASWVRFVRFRSLSSFADIGLPRDVRMLLCHTIDLSCGIETAFFSLGGSTEEECRRWTSA